MILGNVVDKLHDDNRLANPRTPEGSNLAALGKGTNKVDNLDTCLEDGC